MNEKQFYTELLGVKDPWHITMVTLDMQRKRVDIYIEHRPGIQFPCPICQTFCSVYDHTREREFRHLQTCQAATYLHVRVPRIQCPDHGVQQVVHGLAEENSSVTHELERHVLNLEQECSIAGTARLLELDWHTCWDIQERAVARGLARKPRQMPTRLGVDEKSIASGHKYETIVCDLDRGTVDHVADDRDQASLESYYRQFTEEQRAAVKAVAMDMWEPYIAATKAYLPHAGQKIVFDRFHVMRYVIDAVDTVRKQEHECLKRTGCRILTGTKYLWLWNRENIPRKRRSQFRDLRNQDLQTGRAWSIKEHLRHLWSYRTLGWMRKLFRSWYSWATHSRLAPIIKAARTLKAHLKNILTYAIHPITNALSESLNGKIEKVKRLACGFRNRSHYGTAIYFHCGGLDLYPRRSSLPYQIIPA